MSSCHGNESKSLIYLNLLYLIKVIIEISPFTVIQISSWFFMHAVCTNGAFFLDDIKISFKSC